MAAFIHKANRGSVFKNTTEEGKKSTYSGTINVGGVFYFIDLFEEEGRSGSYYNVTVVKNNKQPLEEDIPQ